MASYFKQPDPGFKIPAVPTRYRKPTYNSTQTTCTNVAASATQNDHTVDELEQRLGVLKNLYPPEDHIWKEMINTVNNLCYEKLREQVLQPNSQAQSVYNGTNITACQSISSQYSRPQFSGHLKPADQFLVLNQDPSGYNGTSGYQSVQSSNHLRGQDVSAFNEADEYPHVSLNVRPRTNKNEGSVACNGASEYPSMTVQTARPFGSRKGVSVLDEVNDCTTISLRPRPRVARLSKEALEKAGRNETYDIASPKNNLQILPSEDENDSLCAFFQKKRKPIRKCTATSTTSQIAAKGNSTADLSIPPNRVRVADHLPVVNAPDSTTRKSTSKSRETLRAKRQFSCNDSAKPEPIAVPKTRPRRVNASTAKREIASVTKRATAPTGRKNVAAAKPFSAEPKPAKKRAVKQPESIVNEPSPACGFEQLDDGSMFGDVSSIAGDVSVLGSNTILRSTSKRSKDNGNEMPSHFFSPFANVRSTSGYSAISTPLSKSTAKNVLGKRLKKPSVAAELKDLLNKPKRKKTAALKANIQLLNEADSVTTESECEASDFSDD